MSQNKKREHNILFGFLYHLVHRLFCKCVPFFLRPSQLLWNSNLRNLCSSEVAYKIFPPLWFDQSTEKSAAVFSHGAFYLVCFSNLFILWMKSKGGGGGGWGILRSKELRLFEFICKLTELPILAKASFARSTRVGCLFTVKARAICEQNSTDIPTAYWNKKTWSNLDYRQSIIFIPFVEWNARTNGNDHS